MSQAQRTLSNPVVTDRPLCKTCGAQMSLTLVEPESPGFDRRTFSCPKCKSFESLVVQYKMNASEVAMERFVLQQNVEHYRKLLAATSDAAQRRQIRKLLAELEANEERSPNGK